MTYIIPKYLPSHSADYVSLALDFLQESGLGLTPDLGEVIPYAEAVEEDPNFLFLSLYDPDCGRVVGFHIVSKRKLFSKELVGNHEFTFVHPKYRDFRNARRLIQHSLEWLADCPLVYANSIMVGNSPGYCGILSRLGFVKEGTQYAYRN